MNSEDVVPPLAANMSAAFKKVRGAIGAADPVLRGDDQVPTVPAYSLSEGEASFRAGVMNGLRDGCAAAQSEEIKDWFDRALHRGRFVG